MPVQGSNLSCPQLVSTHARAHWLDLSSRRVLTKTPVHCKPSERSCVLRWLYVLACDTHEGAGNQGVLKYKRVPAGL